MMNKKIHLLAVAVAGCVWLLPGPSIRQEPIKPKPAEIIAQEAIYQPPKQEPVYRPMSVPANRNALAFMYHTAITNKSSPQYALRINPAVYNDEYGFRKYEEYFIVAMGQYYGTTGDRLRITLEDGTSYKVLIGDSKASAHTINDQVCKTNGSIVEFIVGPEFKATSLELFYGKITKIEKEIR